MAWIGGYVGSEHHSYNAFFVRDGLGEALFPAVPPKQGVRSAANWEHQAEDRLSAEGIEWVEVDTVLAGGRNDAAGS